MSEEWALAEFLTKVRLVTAWGTEYGERKFQKLGWPQTEKHRRAYPHNPVAEIDIALAQANAVIGFLNREAA